ncbi:MAG: hypothetical protein ABI347_05645 [Nitrososphaera sp.]|jgi:hypothetical protein
MLFNARHVRDAQDVKREINRIVSRQKPGSKDDLSPFQHEIQELMSFSEFHQEWKKSPAVFRVARLDGDSAYTDNIVLPEVKHDLELVIKMLNHMRGQKGLPTVNMPLFAQPDEIALARGPDAQRRIISQLAIVFQKGAVMWAGFVFGRDYVLLQG